MQSGEPGSVSAVLADRIGRAIDAAGGWLGFERFMEMALYEPGLGYYARHGRKFGLMPASGSDFATAPEMTPLFGRALARQVAQAMDACGVDALWEFGAGSGALARQLLEALAERLTRGAAFFIDYGFPEAEYYHPQRTGGTLMCHRAHRADTDPLSYVGDKDITAHVDFTGIALAGQDAGLHVLGYTSQARFLMNCGLLDLLAGADARTLAPAQKLLAEHEMGELFKVVGFATQPFDAIGFSEGDRSHRL
jgi:SAM-dependent MidA family methyltransferase